MIFLYLIKDWYTIGIENLVFITDKIFIKITVDNQDKILEVDLLWIKKECFINEIISWYYSKIYLIKLKELT